MKTGLRIVLVSVLTLTVLVGGAVITFALDYIAGSNARIATLDAESACLFRANVAQAGVAANFKEALALTNDRLHGYALTASDALRMQRLADETTALMTIVNTPCGVSKR